jgi:membrane protease YdiL (CAAX protease family)
LEETPSSEPPPPEYNSVLEVEEIQGLPEVTEVTPPDDPKWFGVPPNGERPLPPGSTYVLEIFGIMVLEIFIWAIYRYTTAPYLAGFGTELFYIIHIIAAPTIHLIPIILYWRYKRKERGLPFVFTKKLIMSAVIVGFVAAIMWRVLQEFVYDGMAYAAGGVVSGSFTFFNLMDSSTIMLLSLMTFVHFFIVGPVEELEFRSFAQDQAARIIPNWQAVMFSSVLFGCSHIPIALFVYQFPPEVFFVALLGWISAGVVFGVLYMWSRNIFACIVMHGMGNWQLSIFYFQSTEIIGALGTTTYVVIGVASTLVVDGIMILFFYLVHKYYWQPHRRGEPAFGGMFQNLQNFIHEHDFENKPLKLTAIYLVGFIVVTGAIIVVATHALGETDLSKFSTSQVEDEGGGGLGGLESYVETPEILTGSGNLDEGQSETIPLSSEPDKYIKAVTVTITWTDEDDIRYGLRTYENEPDTFSVRITGPNSSASETGSNQHGSEGTISTTLTLSLEEIAELVSEENENYEMLIEITMVEAGDLFTTGLIGFTDTGNSYEYEIEIIWLEPQ